MERKLIPLSDIGVDADGESGSITGYGSIFGNKDFGGDIVVKGAFEKTLRERPNIKFLWGHDHKSPPIGVWESVKEDGKGLLLKGRLFLETERGREVHVALKNGAIDGLSMGYKATAARNTRTGRELHELKLFEVSVVNFPMNEAATVETVKSYPIDGSAAEKKRFLEKHLRDVDVPVKTAKHAASVSVDHANGVRDAAGATAEMADDLKQLLAELRSN